MLLDNKTAVPGKPASVFNYLRKYTGDGQLDVVSGFFSIQILARLQHELNDPVRFRLILGELIKHNAQLDLTIDLLTERRGIEGDFWKRQVSRDAVRFLSQDKVEVKTVKPNFCHAKAYLYEAPNGQDHHNFFVSGSSNLTEAGLGLRPTSNVELNIAKTGTDNEYPDLRTWFDALWKNREARAEIGGVSFKQSLIDEISKLYRDYSPAQLYYKVLFEFFKDDLLGAESDEELQREIKRLEHTVIYGSLFPFQQKGVISLLKKLRTYNGAILADAVGLGKTWSALAVIKYFEMRGYEVVVLCPKKLSYNWLRYTRKYNSLFKADRFDFTVRYHTDLQDERLSKDGFALEEYFQGNPKLLLVIDESHNLRNDKSNRYQFLVQELLKKNDEVKVLMLSATPINTKITDLRNQYKLMVKGEDGGFADTPVQVNSLHAAFSDVQAALNKLSDEQMGDMTQLVQAIPRRFFELTDATIVARTRGMIARQLGGNLHFPKKDKPLNEYIGLVNIGQLASFADILGAIEVNLTAYKPAQYIRQQSKVALLEDEAARQGYLVNMMYMLLIKRLESSWFSFHGTVRRVQAQHTEALAKVLAFRQAVSPTNGPADTPAKRSAKGPAAALAAEPDAELATMLDETDLPGEAHPGSAAPDLSIGKRHPIRLADITDLDGFQRDLEADIAKLDVLLGHLHHFSQQMEAEENQPDLHPSTPPSHDPKLQRLLDIIRDKQATNPNQKVLVFTVFKDTAEYLYQQLIGRGFARVAFVAGDLSRTQDGYVSHTDFEPILERFAPYTKLYRERNWAKLYARLNLLGTPTYEEWQGLMRQHETRVADKLAHPIDILIATDCLSEGQNLQDCDLVINYDIHWNPVRLVQRFGRIDRLGSPNATIAGVNFWPGENYADYLRLKSRVEWRMAQMALLGIELDVPFDEAMSARLASNPLLTEQERKMLEQLQETWDDLEDGAGQLSFDKLTLEDYRQELLDFLNSKRQELEAIPNGVFTGFQAQPDLFNHQVPAGLIALLRYVGPPDTTPLPASSKESGLYLLYTTPDGVSEWQSNADILAILRRHKSQARLVPAALETSDPAAIAALGAQVRAWLDHKAGRTHVEAVLDLFQSMGPPTATARSRTDLKLEEKFQPDNFELVTWFIVS